MTWISILWKYHDSLLTLLGVLLVIGLGAEVRHQGRALEQANTSLANVMAQEQANLTQYNAIVKAVNEQQRGNDDRAQQQQQAAAELASKRGKSLPMDDALRGAYNRLYAHQDGAKGGNP